MKKNIVTVALALAGLAGSAGSASAQVVRTNDILPGCGTATGCLVTGTEVWGDDETEVVLDGPVFVKDGGLLDIRPGLIVRGQPRYSGVVAGQTRGTPGVIIVTRDGEIDAEGLPTNPVIMTTAAVDNNNDDVADDFDGNGFEDQWPGFTGPCTAGVSATAPEGPDNILGTGDDDLGTCVIDATPSFLDDTPKTAPLAPLNAAGDANVALWGGVVILGSAPSNVAGTTTTSGTIGTGVIEGLPVPGYPEADCTYGGAEPHDSSGTFRYVSVRHGGDEIGEGNELNGVTLGAVGDGTQFDHVEVYANFDDGFEWFGGTVNPAYLLVAYVGDDSFDVDDGHTGVHQFHLSISPFFNEHDCANATCNTGGFYGSVSGDNAGEWDGDDCGGDCNLAGPDSFAPTGGFGEAGAWPPSAAFFYNLTALGNALDKVHVNGVLTAPVFDPNDVCTAASTPWSCCTGLDTGFCTASDNRGINMKAGFMGELINSYIVNTGTARGVDIGGGGAPGWEVPDNICADTQGNDGLGDLVRIRTSTFDDVAALTGPGNCAVTGGTDVEALANGDGITPGTPGPATSNIYNDVVTRTGLPAPGAGVPGLRNEDVSFDPQGIGGKLTSALRVSPINPRPAGALGFSGATSTEGHPVANSSALFRGAFPTAGDLWTTGWTAMNVGGILID